MKITFEELKPHTKTILSRIDYQKDFTTGKDVCWLWTGVREGNGYGRYYLEPRQKRPVKAHQATWMIFNGRDIPKDREIAHLCNNVRCCKPTHLEAQTHRQNMEYMKDSGTFNRRIMSEGSVRMLLLDHRQGYTEFELADKYDLTPKMVGNIKSGRAWKPVHEAFQREFGPPDKKKIRANQKQRLEAQRDAIHGRV